MDVKEITQHAGDAKESPTAFATNKPSWKNYLQKAIGLMGTSLFVHAIIQSVCHTWVVPFHPRFP